MPARGDIRAAVGFPRQIDVPATVNGCGQAYFIVRPPIIGGPLTYAGGTEFRQKGIMAAPISILVPAGGDARCAIGISRQIDVSAAVNSRGRAIITARSTIIGAPLTSARGIEFHQKGISGAAVSIVMPVGSDARNTAGRSRQVDVLAAVNSRRMTMIITRSPIIGGPLTCAGGIEFH